MGNLPRRPRTGAETRREPHDQDARSIPSGERQSGGTAIRVRWSPAGRRLEMSQDSNKKRDGGCSLTACSDSSFMEMAALLEAMKKDQEKLWKVVVILALTSLVLGADAWVQGNQIRKLSNPRHLEEVPRTPQEASTGQSKTSASSTPVGLNFLRDQKLLRSSLPFVPVLGNPATFGNNDVPLDLDCRTEQWPEDRHQMICRTGLFAAGSSVIFSPNEIHHPSAESGLDE